MRKECVVLILFTPLITIALVESVSEGPKALEEWFKELPHKKHKVTNLHFYFHDTISGPTQTAYLVAQSDVSSTFPTEFGKLLMFDNPLTVAPDDGSEMVGKGQGLYGFASLEEFSLLMNLNFVFTKGKYKSSTLHLLGLNPILHPFREMSIVGGSGVFRLARGIATAQTYSLNATTAVVEYNVIVIHY